MPLQKKSGNLSYAPRECQQLSISSYTVNEIKKLTNVCEFISH